MKGNVTSLGMHSEMPSPRAPWAARQSHPTKWTPGRPRKWGGREKQLASLPHSSGPPRPLPLGTASRPTDREARGALLGPSPYWREGTEHTRQYNPGAHAHPAQPKRQTTARPTRRPAARLRLPQAGRAAANTGLPSRSVQAAQTLEDGKGPCDQKGCRSRPRVASRCPRERTRRRAEGTNVANAALRRGRPEPLRASRGSRRVSTATPLSIAVKRRRRYPANTTPSPTRPPSRASPRRRNGGRELRWEGLIFAPRRGRLLGHALEVGR